MYVVFANKITALSVCRLQNVSKRAGVFIISALFVCATGSAHAHTIGSEMRDASGADLKPSMSSAMSSVQVIETAQNRQNFSEYQQTQDVTTVASTGRGYDPKLLDPKLLMALAEHPQWHHLLYYKDGHAEVISADFYLTAPNLQSKHRKRQNFSPYAELLATLDAVEDASVRCRFPARYYWLSHKLPHFVAPLSDCTDLPDAGQPVSLLLVSSYLKNPASSFGHVLVKTHSGIIPAAGMYEHVVNQTSQVQVLSSDDLLNDSYNFGARIPPNENGVLYALKGLFGFYDAGFAKAEFFKQDAVYSKHEQRDMWEYVLDLDDFNTRLLNYHLYEAQSARFTYYFIKQNCGYRSGELLELVSDINTTQRPGGWYAPDYVFDQLKEYGSGQQPSLIRSVRYLPSAQTQIRQYFGQLSPELQLRINAFIKQQDMSVLEGVSGEDQALMLDFLILHGNYKLSQTDVQKKPMLQDTQKQLVRRRFALPAGTGLSQLSIENKPSPALSNKTSKTHIAVSEEAVTVGMAMFSKDPLNTHTDINKRFEAMKFQGSYGQATRQQQDGSRLRLDEFVFLDMQQIENLAQPLAGEPRLSWQLKTGLQTDPIDVQPHSAYAQGGIGAGWQSTVNTGYELLGYGFINGRVHDQAEHIDASTELGLRVKKDHQALQLSYLAHKRASAHWVQRTELTLRHAMNKNNGFRLQLSHEDNPNVGTQDQSQDTSNRYGKQTQLQLAWQHYW